MPGPDRRDDQHTHDGRGDALSGEEYDLLRRIAADYLRRERPGHTLQPTALVNEAILRLGDGDGPRWNDRRHFVATAARAMRRVLVDYARARLADKRGGGVPRALDVEAVGAGEGDAVDLLALDEALSRLDTLHERQARVVELRFFAGFTVAETAEHLGVSERTVELDWSVARAWLKRELRGGT